MRVLPTTRADKLRVALALVALAAAAWFGHVQDYYYYARYQPEEGDIVFQSLPHGDLVDAIEGITHSPYSHCGVVLRDRQGVWVVIEAIANVHETPLLGWIKRGRNGDFTAYRLDPKYSALLPKFKLELLAFAGRPYDYNYDMTDTSGAYCSSLVYLAFQKASGEKLGELQKLRDLDWKPYTAFIYQEQNGALPLDRVMITPAALSRAPQLHEVYHSGLW
jgi:hypothetical protein